MSDHGALKMPPAARELSGRAAIVGLGESDYALDYQAARAKAPGFEPPTPERLAQTAFERALADSGLKREDIDGVSVSFLYGGPTAAETAEHLGLEPRYAKSQGGIMAGPLPVVCADIAAGEADTVAMIYAVASRSIGRKYGGKTYSDDAMEEGGAPLSYYYHHPWGWSSQAAHWAFVWSYYQAAHGATEADLAEVAMQLRRNAMANDNAIMRKPLTLEDYLASRYVVRPLHLFDLCLVNDGAVCLIVRRADKASGLPHAPVLVAGWGESKVKETKMDYLVRQRLRPQCQDAAAQAFGMAGLSPADVGHFEGYDASTIHLISQLEGFGFAEPGAGLAGWKTGDYAPRGKLPVNTAGGMLSGSYMHGWNHVAEITRQVRGEAGERQTPNLKAALFSLAQTDQVHPILFTRGVQ
jgi:acetyl-CoA acetyltransferase